MNSTWEGSIFDEQTKDIMRRAINNDRIYSINKTPNPDRIESIQRSIATSIKYTRSTLPCQLQPPYVSVFPIQLTFL